MYTIKTEYQMISKTKNNAKPGLKSHIFITASQRLTDNNTSQRPVEKIIENGVEINEKYFLVD